MEKQEALRTMLIEANCPETGDFIVDKICKLFGYADTNEFVATKVMNIAEAREQAISWQSWANEQELSYSELSGWQYHFEKLGRKYKLTDEFKENGII